MALISARDVSLRYENAVAVERVSFEVGDGEFLSIVGENGSGKSTLLKGLLGLMPLSRGEIAYGGGLRRSEIGYLPQQTPVQRDFPASVREVVLSGCLGRRGWRPFYSAADRERCRESMGRLGVLALQKRSFRDLSGGQQQRVLLARALCATTKLLLLDEPATGLDPIAMTELSEAILRLNREQGVAVVMVSHDIGAAVRAGGTILQLSPDGGAAYYGPAAEYLRSEAGKRLTGGERADA